MSKKNASSTPVKTENQNEESVKPSEELPEVQQTVFERLPNGLVKGINYEYTPEGFINWRKLIPEKYLYIQSNDPKKVKEIVDKYGKQPKDLKPSEVDDKYLCILLAGIRYLAFLRGFKSEKRKVDNIHFDSQYNITSGCTITSEITWIGNFETGGCEVTSSDQAGASFGNVESFMKRYVETAASNRAFVRNVRGFLNIGIVGKDELAPTVELLEKEAENPAISFQPQSLLETKVKQAGLNFEKLKSHSVKYYASNFLKTDPNTWENYASIPKPDVFVLLGKIAEREELNSKK